MSLRVKPKTVKELRHMHRDDDLDLSPAFQRRDVWGDKKKMLLIDSIARGIPVNALTFFADNTEDGIKHDAIDGKQRLTSIFEYFSDGFVPNSEVINEESEEEQGDEIQGEGDRGGVRPWVRPQWDTGVVGAPGAQPTGAGGCPAALTSHADPGVPDAGSGQGTPRVA